MIWSSPAKVDLRPIHDFIAHDSKHYAKKVTQSIVAKTDVLTEWPRVGKVVPELCKELMWKRLRLARASGTGAASRSMKSSVSWLRRCRDVLANDPRMPCGYP